MNADLKVNTTGFAPIPAFSFDSPILHPSVDIKLKRLNLSSDVTIGLNGKPWLLNLRAKYILVDEEKYKLSQGANPFLFFYENLNLPFDAFIVAQRNFSLEIGSEIKIFKKTGLRLKYLNNSGFDPGALSGNYFSLGLFYGPLYHDKNLSLSFNPDINYLCFEGNIEGSFFNSFLVVDFIRVPVKVQFQLVRKLSANFDVFNFSWNTGIVWSFIMTDKK